MGLCVFSLVIYLLMIMRIAVLLLIIIKSEVIWVISHCFGLGHGTMTCIICRVMLLLHYDDVIMGSIASQITSLTIVYSIVYSDADQRKHQSSASLAFVRWIHRDRWIHCTNGQLRGKCFHLMTSSWTGVSSHCDKRLCMFIMIAIICTTKIILTCSTI